MQEESRYDSGYFWKDRKNVKNIRKTIKENKSVLKLYDKIIIREMFRKFSIPYSTVQDQVKIEEIYKSSEALFPSLRFNRGGRKSDTYECVYILLAFIKESR